MNKEDKIRIHRSRKPAMVQLAKEFAAELEQVCKKYNTQLKPYYMFILSDDKNKKGIMYTKGNKLLLLDLYLSESDESTIDLVHQ